MKVLLAQCMPRVGDISANAEMIKRIMADAEAQACEMVVFPELVVTGYPPEDLLLRPAFMQVVEQAVDTIVQASKSVCCVFGAPRRDTGEHEVKLKNAAFLCQNGKIIGIYDKKYLPNYGVFDEKRYFYSGTGTSIFTVNGKQVGVGICEDLWQDELAEKQACEPVELWLNLNASPFHWGKQQERETLTKRRAAQFSAPVLYVNPVGGQDEVVFDGGSHAFNANGELSARAAMFEETSLLCNIEHMHKNIVALPSQMQLLHDALVMGVRDYVRRNGCSQVVIGLSGGIDSAVVAVIAVEALGAENVLGVLLPSQYSSEHSLTDAHALVSNLGIGSITLPIADGVESINATLADTFTQWEKSQTDVTEENIQARIRGVLLMAISNKTGRMLLTTGNKSEMAVGYATLYGDMAGGFAVIKDVYKMQVFALAHYMNRAAEIVPQNSIDKPPSAELAPDQKDSDSLPDYDVLDAILQASIEDHLSVDEITAQGFERQEVVRIVRLLQQSEYKRRQAPPGVKITLRAFGRDRRYPMTHAFLEK
ncbi:MAG: NAD+ synthase [Mariprofundaceae bacterium]|nr:NAD+ synthase [Mariprofundaceae bacterium]